MHRIMQITTNRCRFCRGYGAGPLVGLRSRAFSGVGVLTDAHVGARRRKRISLSGFNARSRACSLDGDRTDHRHGRCSMPGSMFKSTDRSEQRSVARGSEQRVLPCHRPWLCMVGAWIWQDCLILKCDVQEHRPLGAAVGGTGIRKACHRPGLCMVGARNSKDCA